MKKLLLVAALLSLSAIASAGQDVLLASAVRATTTSTDDLVRTTERQVTVALIVTAVPGGDTLTATLQGKTYSGTYYTIVAGAASANTGTVLLKAGPGIASVTNVAIGDMIPDVYRVTITHSGAGNFTYSLERNTSQ